MKGILFAISFGIAILLPMLVNYGVNIFNPVPMRADYNPPLDTSITETAPEVRAQRFKEYQEREKKYEQVYGLHQKYLFYVAVPVGLIAILVGLYLKLPAIGSGLVFGGVFTLLEGYWSYWSHLVDWIKFISILIALVMLILMAYRRFTPKTTIG
jgi:hypothetical protein